MTRNSYERNPVLPLDQCQPPAQTPKTILCCIDGECTDIYTTSFDCAAAGGSVEEYEKFQIDSDKLLFIFDIVNWSAEIMVSLIYGLQYKRENGVLPQSITEVDLNEFLNGCNFKLKNNLLVAQLKPAPKGIVVGYTNFEAPGNKIYKFLIRIPPSVFDLNGRRTQLKSVFDWTPVIYNQQGPINGSVYDNPTLKHYCEILNEGNYISYDFPDGTNDLDKILNPLDDIRDIYWHAYYIIDTGVGPGSVPNIEMYINGKKEFVPITGHIGKYNNIYYALLKNGDWQEITVGNDKTCEDMVSCTPAPSTSPSPSPSMLYFYSSGSPDNYWDTTSNWWTNEAHSNAANRVPSLLDSATILNNVSRININPALAITNLYVKNEASIDTGIEITVADTATFLDSSYNGGTIHGNCIFMQNSTHAGTIDGNATFNDSSNQLGSVSGVLVCNTSGICGI